MFSIACYFLSHFEKQLEKKENCVTNDKYDDLRQSFEVELHVPVWKLAITYTDGFCLYTVQSKLN